jgi:hypothetical protein
VVVAVAVAVAAAAVAVVVAVAVAVAVGREALSCESCLLRLLSFSCLGRTCCVHIVRITRRMTLM